MNMHACKRACLYACLRACVRACVRASERASMRAFVRMTDLFHTGTCCVCNVWVWVRVWVCRGMCSRGMCGCVGGCAVVEVVRANGWLQVQSGKIGLLLRKYILYVLYTFSHFFTRVHATHMLQCSNIQCSNTHTHCFTHSHGSTSTCTCTCTWTSAYMYAHTYAYTCTIRIHFQIHVHMHKHQHRHTQYEYACAYTCTHKQ